MEKETDKGNVVLKEEENVGVVQIADDVVAMIATLAATEVEGVSAMGSKMGVKKLTKGVRVDVLEGNVTVCLAVIIEYGYNIPATCQKVQAKVKAAIENMTGLTCSDVNIRIAGVKVKKA
ncbi:MAG: Asp23/Gls24 family envelope stress response protein [Acetatifactor sp.]